jgi:hypothetical protein
VRRGVATAASTGCLRRCARPLARVCAGTG